MNLEYWKNRYAEKGRMTVGNIDFSPEKFEAVTLRSQEILRAEAREYFKGRQVLDFGCGFGRMSAVLCELSASVAGVDVVPWVIEEARKHCPKAEFALIENGAGIPFPPKQFGGVLSWTVLQHISPGAIETACREIQRVMAPGGYLVIYENCTVTPDKPHIWFRGPEIYEILFSHLDKVDEQIIPGVDGNREVHVLMVFRK